uniref:Uncharacterized protein LOC117366749 n=1 Tax=Geotrypetes seraphini TaxID=260995 RepID=A0A6P8S8D7_GEOSA|nr:uncharacterized protein LOC117366749 [Geotrypetes seraphini]
MASSFVLPDHEYPWLVRQAHRPIQRDKAEIRINARASWKYEMQRRLENPTTYTSEFGRKVLDEPTQWRVRPESSHRLHNPQGTHMYGIQKPQNFMEYCGLKKRMAKAERGESRQSLCYPPHCQSLCHPPHCLQGFNKFQELENALPDTNSFLAARAWLTLANEKDRKAVESMIAGVSENIKETAKTEKNGRKRYIYQMLDFKNMVFEPLQNPVSSF